MYINEVKFKLSKSEKKCKGFGGGQQNEEKYLWAIQINCKSLYDVIVETLCRPGNFSLILFLMTSTDCCSKSTLLKFFKEYHQSVKQFWIQIRLDILSGLIWFQIICKGYECYRQQLISYDSITIKIVTDCSLPVGCISARFGYFHVHMCESVICAFLFLLNTTEYGIMDSGQSG